ncbi:MAG: hypothetical protein ACK6CT_06715 [Planctomycetia bacterium]|jgi:hypothetical protein
MVERFGISANGKSKYRGIFEAFREYVKKTAETNGEQLHPMWFPDQHPELWAHRPEILQRLGIEPPKPSSED